MTWNELKEKIDAMPEAERALPVRVWGEGRPLLNTSFERTHDAMYWNPYWDGCVERGELDDEDRLDPDTTKVIDAGVAYLWIE